MSPGSSFLSGALFLLAMPLAFAAPQPQSPATVSVIAVKKIELSESLIYPARVVPKINSMILAEIDGVISKIHSPLGQSVSSGARILTISHTDPVYQFAPFKVTSPISGVISSLEVTEGTQVIKGQKLGAVTDPRKIRFMIEIPASDLAFFSRGMKGTFQISGRDQSIPVVIRGVSPFVDPATGTASGELEPAGGAALVAPGLMGQVSFNANLHQGYSIPEHVIVYKGDATFVRVLKDGKSKMAPVKLGHRQKGMFEVLSGIDAGMTLIERSSRFIAEGEAVQVSAGT